MNTKAKGELSEGIILAALLKLGHSVAVPFGNNQRYDLILDEGGTLLRVQAKTGRMYQGCVVFNACSTNPYTGKKTGYTGQVDLFLVYCPATDKVYRVPVEVCGTTEVRLRVDPLTRGARPGVRWAADFELTGI